MLLTLCLSLYGLVATAQGSEKTVTGTVTDASGDPLANATVLVKGTKTATATGSDGKFTIKVPTDKSVLVVSFVGMTAVEQVVGNRTSLVIKMSQEAGKMDDVVVIGYGTVRKRDLTGSVTKIDAKELQRAPVLAVDQALAGRISGVQVMSRDGQPGENADVIVRGVGSITQSTSPLYVIDGFPSESANFNALNPNDIESIEVLKDASSTAIYGARGSNGVIIITTKRGRSATPVLQYNTYYGTQRPLKKMEMMSPYEFVRMQNDINPRFANAVYFTNGTALEDYRNREGIDWQDLLFQDNPTFQSHNISLSAKVNKTAYTISGSYGLNDGLIINSGFKRYQGRFTLDQDVNDNIRMGVNVNYSRSKTWGQSTSTQNTPLGQVINNTAWYFMTNLWSYRPVLGSNAKDLSFVYEALLDNNVDEGGVPNGRTNPYIQTKNEVSDRYTTLLTANGYLQLKFLRNFTLRSTIGYNYGLNESYRFFNSMTNQGSPLTSYGQTNGINGSMSTGNSYSYLNENMLTYQKAFNKNHELTMLAGATIQKNWGESYGFTAVMLPNESLGVKGLGQGTPKTTSSGASLSTMASFLSRVNYSLNKKYLFTVSMRADGSSKFRSQNFWGYFPSGAIAWRLGDEKFIKKQKFITDAKVRASIGTTGNNRVDDFATYSQLGTTSAGSTSGSFYTWNNQIVYATTVSSMANAKLVWEKGIQKDLGLEFSVLKRRLNVELDVYDRRTIDLIHRSSMPYSTGFSNVFQNVGKVRNQGLEITLNSINVKTTDFEWRSNFNISFNQNKLLALNNGEVALLSRKAIESALEFDNYIAMVGQPISMFYGLIADGMYQYKDFYKVYNGAGGGVTYVLKENIPYYNTAGTVSNPSTSTTLPVQPGDPKFKDLNGDGIIDNRDKTIIGNPYPKHYGGLSNNFTYKGFDLNVFVQWSYGNQIMNANRLKFEQTTNASLVPSALTDGNLGFNMFATYVNRWTPTNPSDLYPRVNAHAGGTRQYSTRIIEDGSYLRLKTVQLGYNLPSKLLKRIKLSNARFYLAAQNLLTLTGYTGPDPEVSTAGNGLTAGYDYSPYPRTRVLTVGTTITF